MKRYFVAMIALFLLLALAVSCEAPFEDPTQQKEPSQTGNITASESEGSDAEKTEPGTNAETTGGSNAVWTPFF